MGDIADYYEGLALAQEAEWEAERHLRLKVAKEIEKKYLIGILKWNTENDGRILVSKMSENHIKNCITFIQRVSEEDDEISQKWIEIFGYELEKRKENERSND